MYVVVEAWTPKPAFLAASADEKAAVVDGVKAAIVQLAADGITCLGMGELDAETYASAHQWVAVWTMPTKEHSDAFLDGVTASGWYGYFEQTNLRAELVPAGDALDQHLKLA